MNIGEYLDRENPNRNNKNRDRTNYGQTKTGVPHRPMVRFSRRYAYDKMFLKKGSSALKAGLPGARYSEQQARNAVRREREERAATLQFI